MKSQNRLKTILIMLLLLLLVSACTDKQKPLIENNNIITQSNKKVDIVASNAVAYSWKQISGIEVVLINTNTDTLSFIAPIVQTKETLVFELEALVPSALEENSIRKERATVIVHPLEVLSDNNTTEPTDTNTTPPTNPLKSIALSISSNSLNIDTNTTLNAIATYEDNTTKEITNEVEWISTDLNAIQISKHQLKAKRETNIILQARLNTITSNAVALNIYREINGHRLPPEPNEAINNSTLLGIDSNDNGVRDDVERWIYTQYKRPIEQAYMMQSAILYPKFLEDPVAAAVSEELEKEHWNNAVCEGFLRNYKKVPLGVQTVTFMEDAYFNTKERMRAYIEFNEASSGGVYHIPLLRDYKASSCDFNVTKLLEMKK